MVSAPHTFFAVPLTHISPTRTYPPPPPHQPFWYARSSGLRMLWQLATACRMPLQASTSAPNTFSPPLTTQPSFKSWRTTLALASTYCLASQIPTRNNLQHHLQTPRHAATTGTPTCTLTSSKNRETTLLLLLLQTHPTDRIHESLKLMYSPSMMAFQTTGSTPLHSPSSASTQ